MTPPARAIRLRDPSRDLACASCGEDQAASELDRHLWCPACIAGERARARRIGWACGAALGVGLSLWIALVQQPSRMLLGGWAGAVLAAVWLGGRAGMEIAYGIARFRGRPR